MAYTDGLAWIDLETTGTDEEQDCIIEVGLILTDWTYEVKYENVWVCKPTALGLGRMMQNDVVREMHEKNGLLSTCQGRAGNYNAFDTKLAVSNMRVHYLEAVDSHVRTRINQYLGNRVMLAGSGVGHFDRRFIDKQMPETAKTLTYPPFDIGCVRRFLRAVDGNWASLSYNASHSHDKTHRALDDIRQHLAEAKLYKDILIKATGLMVGEQQIPEATKPELIKPTGD